MKKVTSISLSLMIVLLTLMSGVFSQPALAAMSDQLSGAVTSSSAVTVVLSEIQAGVGSHVRGSLRAVGRQAIPVGGGNFSFNPERPIGNTGFVGWAVSIVSDDGRVRCSRLRIPAGGQWLGSSCEVGWLVRPWQGARLDAAGIGFEVQVAPLANGSSSAPTGGRPAGDAAPSMPANQPSNANEQPTVTTAPQATTQPQVEVGGAVVTPLTSASPALPTATRQPQVAAATATMPPPLSTPTASITPIIRIVPSATPTLMAMLMHNPAVADGTKVAVVLKPNSLPSPEPTSIAVTQSEDSSGGLSGGQIFACATIGVVIIAIIAVLIRWLGKRGKKGAATNGGSAVTGATERYIMPSGGTPPSRRLADDDEEDDDEEDDDEDQDEDSEDGDDDDDDDESEDDGDDDESEDDDEAETNTQAATTTAGGRRSGYTLG